MRNAALAALLGCLALAVGRSADAQEGPKLETTADLLAYCDNEGPVGEVRDGQNFCDGFIMGNGLLYAEQVRAGSIERLACAERVPSLAEAHAAFVAWAQANPDHLRDKPVDGFWRAMAATYPCPD
jgi:hypothetical protein